MTLFVDPVVPCGAATRDDHGWTPSTNRHHNISQNQAGFSISPSTVPGTGAPTGYRRKEQRSWTAS